MKKKQPEKRKISLFYLHFYAFLSITLELLIAVSIYSCLIKDYAKQLPFHYTNNEWREFLY